jgi:general secretion pathway protein M
MSSSSADTAPAGLAAVRRALRDIRGRWAALAPRERRLVGLAGTVLGAFLVWSLAIAPAWRTLQTAPARLDAQQRQAQQMQLQAGEAAALRAVAPVPLDQAQAALTAATERLGPPNKLSLQGERALLTLKGVGGEALAAWLAEARAGARARVVEASLTMTGPGVYDGSLTLALGAGR